MFHHHTLNVAQIGAAVITLFSSRLTGFKDVAGIGGLAAHAVHAW
jgi:hypothetical protein